MCLWLCDFPSCLSEYTRFNPQVGNGTIRGMTEKWFTLCAPSCRGRMPLLPTAVPLRPSWEDWPRSRPHLRPTFASSVPSHDHSVIQNLQPAQDSSNGRGQGGLCSTPFYLNGFFWRMEPRSKGYRYYMLSEHKTLILSLPRTSASPVSTRFFPVYPLKLFEDKEAPYPLPRKVPHAKRSFQVCF